MVNRRAKYSIRDRFGVWRFADGRMDMGKYELNSEGRLEEIKPEEINACVEDEMTHEEYVEHQYEHDAENQRDKYGEADRDEEERKLNEHQTGGDECLA